MLKYIKIFLVAQHVVNTENTFIVLPLCVLVIITKNQQRFGKIPRKDGGTSPENEIIVGRVDNTEEYANVPRQKRKKNLMSLLPRISP